MKKINFKRSALALGAISTVVAPIATITSCSLFKSSGSSSKSKYEFYNYEDYMDTDIHDSIASSFSSYYEFADLPEIEQGINDETVGAAVGSDYYNAMLAGKGKISKLDFSKLYGITADHSLWAGELRKLYTPETWSLLTSFRVAKLDNQGNILDENGERVYDNQGVVKKDDKGNDRTPTYDVDGDGHEDFLWEFMAPYFIQNKVMAVNVDKLATYSGAPASVKNLDADGHSQISNANFNNLFTNKTYKGILDTLKGWGAGKLTVNDYMRDNLMIGAQTNGKFTGKITGTEYEGMVSGFQKTISGWSATPISSGVGTLTSLIHAEGNDEKADAALMYNGDALMAWFGGAEDPDNDASQIRIVNPEDPSFLLDGFVIPTYVGNDYSELNKIYEIMKSNLYGSAATTWNSNPTTVDGSVSGVDFRAAFTSGNNLFKNFDYVNYTPAFKAVYDYVESKYFDNDDTAVAIYASTKSNSSKIDENHVTYPITDKQFSDITQLYDSSKSKW